MLAKLIGRVLATDSTDLADSCLFPGMCEWNSSIRAAYDANGKLADYSITFIRKREDTYWYDEIRYDSHERRHGRKVLAPHFHLKIHCTFKANADTAVEEISSLIDNYLQRMEKIIGT